MTYNENLMKRRMKFTVHKKNTEDMVARRKYIVEKGKSNATQK
jgi:hypothetical protein